MDSPKGSNNLQESKKRKEKNENRRGQKQHFILHPKKYVSPHALYHCITRHFSKGGRPLSFCQNIFHYFTCKYHTHKSRIVVRSCSPDPISIILVQWTIMMSYRRKMQSSSQFTKLWHRTRKVICRRDRRVSMFQPWQVKTNHFWWFLLGDTEGGEKEGKKKAFARLMAAYQILGMHWTIKTYPLE